MRSASLNGYLVKAPENKDHLLSKITDYKGILVAMNAEKILKKNEKLKLLINENLGYPDGIGAVLALRQKGFSTVKIAGADLWLDIILKFYQKKTFYLIGASEEVINLTVEKLKIRFPKIQIKGFRNGFIYNNIEKEELIADINEKKPDVVFVAMGTPKQEFLMEEILNQHKALYMGLGGSFDVFTGKKKRAPKFFINNWLEWFYRLIKEPTRLKRQLVLIKFLLLILFNRV